MSTSPRELEALELHFGEETSEVYARTRSYVKGLIGKGWWVSQKQLLQNEGPLDAMVYDCLMYIIEHGGMVEGYKAYTQYLAKEYGTSQVRNMRHADIDVLRYTPATAAPPSLGTDTAVEPDVHVPEWLAKEEAEFLSLYKHVGMSEAVEHLDMDLEAGWREYRRIKEKIRRNTT